MAVGHRDRRNPDRRHAHGSSPWLAWVTRPVSADQSRFTSGLRTCGETVPERRFPVTAGRSACVPGGPADRPGPGRPLHRDHGLGASQPRAASAASIPVSSASAAAYGGSAKTRSDGPARRPRPSTRSTRSADHPGAGQADAARRCRGSPARPGRPPRRAAPGPRRGTAPPGRPRRSPRTGRAPARRQRAAHRGQRAEQRLPGPVAGRPGEPARPARPAGGRRGPGDHPASSGTAAAGHAFSRYSACSRRAARATAAASAGCPARAGVGRDQRRAPRPGAPGRSGPRRAAASAAAGASGGRTGPRRARRPPGAAPGRAGPARSRPRSRPPRPAAPGPACPRPPR